MEDDLKDDCLLLVWLGKNRLYHYQQKNRKEYYVLARDYHVYVHASHLMMWMLRMEYARPVNRLYREKDQLRQVMLVMLVAVGLIVTMVMEGGRYVVVVVVLLF